MAIRLVESTHMPEAEVREAAIFVTGQDKPIEAHFHKCAEKGDIHVCIHDTHKAAAVAPKHHDHDDDHDEDEESEVAHAEPAPPSVTRESLFNKRLRLVINDGKDSNYNGHFGPDGLFIPAR